MNLTDLLDDDADARGLWTDLSDLSGKESLDALPLSMLEEIGRPRRECTDVGLVPGLLLL